MENICITVTVAIDLQDKVHLLFFWLLLLHVTFARKSLSVIFPSASKLITETLCQKKNKLDNEQWTPSCTFHLFPCQIVAEPLSIRYTTWQASPLSHPANPHSLPARTPWQEKSLSGPIIIPVFVYSGPRDRALVRVQEISGVLRPGVKAHRVSR